MHRLDAVGEVCEDDDEDEDEDDESVDGKNSQRYYQMFFECMRKEVVIGGGDIKEGECILGGRGLFIGYREVRRVGDEGGEIKWVNIGFYRRV